MLIAQQLVTFTPVYATCKPTLEMLHKRYSWYPASLPHGPVDGLTLQQQESCWTHTHSLRAHTHRSLSCQPDHTAHGRGGSGLAGGRGPGARAPPVLVGNGASASAPSHWVHMTTGC